jgi:hypothetical protein
VFTFSPLVVKAINMSSTIDTDDIGDESKTVGSWAAATDVTDDEEDEDDHHERRGDQLKPEIKSVQLSPRRRRIPKKPHKSPRNKKRRRSRTRSASRSDDRQRRVRHQHQHHNHKQNINQYRPRNPPMHRRIDLLEQTLHRIYDQCHRNHVVICGIQRSVLQQQQQQQPQPVQRHSYQNTPWDSNQTTADTAWK